MSDKLTDVIQTLYSKDNKAEWNEKREEGLEQFLKSNDTFKWEGFSVWEVGNGTVNCFYDAEIELHPTKMAGQNKNLQKLLKKNPFMTKESIREFYEKKLKEYLDSEFEEYCTCDDYYEPVVEDFELTYDVEHWCKENGLEVVSCEGEGRDGGYEPKFRALICTLKLVELKAEDHALSKSEKYFFGDERTLKKNYLKPLRDKEM